MITIKDLFTLLATGEFSNIALSKNSTGGINESEYAKVIGHLNLGMVEIYKRFRLLENELTLNVVPTTSLYYLRNDNLIDETPASTKYIELATGQDSINIIEVTGVFDVDGNELAINNRYTTPSIIQLSSDTLKVSKITEAAVYNVVYQAHPNKVILDDTFDIETCILNLSDVVVEALLFYIASRVYKPTGANNSTVNADKSASYQQQYELSCQKIDLFGLGVQNCDDENTFENDGWA